MKLLLLSVLTLTLISCTKKGESVSQVSELPIPQQAEMALPPDLPDPSADLPADTKPASHQRIKVDINAKDLTCKKDSDCSIVRTQCSCHCGEAVHKAHAAKYSDQATELCKTYSGPMCKKLCSGEAKCVAKVCTYVP